jgi:ubiquinone/menaquinone biosynthesis C-methylase UbiE
VIARGRLPSTAIVNGTILALPFRTQSVDVVVAQGVLELLDDWRPALAELARVATRAVLFTSPAAGASSCYHHHIPAVGWVTIHTLARADVLKWATAQLFTAHEIACGGRTLFVLQH